MNPNFRKFALTAHITLSVGWLGAVVAYLALAIAGLTGQDSESARAAYLAMDVIAWFVIVPFSVATLLAGLLESLGTPWGLFRHERRSASLDELTRRPESVAEVDAEPTTNTPRWVSVVGIHAIGLAFLFLIVHLTGGGMRSH